MGVTFTLSDKAYVKLVLHALKFPFRNVNGVLVGRVAGDNTVEVLDAIPMLHSSLDVTPNVEMALEQAAAHAALTPDPTDSAKTLTLVGYYHANELKADDRFGKNAGKIADAVANGVDQGKACALLIDPARLGLAMQESVTPSTGGTGAPVVTLLVRKGVGWERAADQAGELAVRGNGCTKAVSCYQDGMAAKLVDFDDHLDDLTKDWRNLHLDDAIAQSLA
eukprot:CAMPEP_0198702456 /NCGR_PEP_ID=MMETSP1468-20131203/388771_1 /TAXON_ID=1461545 /ORGANISM="Mantoniella sp, Strain CCMP1436" /LENGTH=221 /DNA_ID=CAMNT_0044460995 /DNA_START=28 /DNA_END=693 /DNA_ORIENTATION=-